MENTNNSTTTTISYKISEDYRLIHKLFGMTPDVLHDLERIREKAGKGHKSVIAELLKLIVKYPHIPQFHNLLTDEYRISGDIDKAFSLNRLIVAEHPNYLFGKLNLASEYIKKEQFDLAHQLLGEELELQSLYPDRHEFHVGEFIAYYQVVFNYLLHIENLELLEVRFEMFKEINAKFNWLKKNDLLEIEKNITSLRLYKESKKYIKEREGKRHILPKPEQVVPLSTVRPEYNHKEVLELYEYNFDIDKEILQNILNLPRKTLIEDLHTMIHDSIARFKYLEENNEDGLSIFLLHAMYLLTELKSYESLPILLDTMRQDDAYCELNFGDFQTDYVCDCFMVLAENQLDFLQQYLFEPYRYTYSRAAVVAAVTQLALQNPSRRDEVIAWFDELIKNILAHENDDSIIDVDWIGLMVSDATDLKASQLLPQIKLLFDKDLVETMISGDYDAVAEAIIDSSEPLIFNHFENIFDRYDELKKAWQNEGREVSDSYYDDQKELYYDEEEEEKTQPAVNPNKTLNRNDPCPCGSGKKYKKCCGK